MFNTSPITLIKINQMLHSMHVMLALLMSPRTNNDQADIKNQVKVFLSCCHQYAKINIHSESSLFWHRTGNFTTILCLPDQVKKYGSVRLYWEGTSERHIQNVKNFLANYSTKDIINKFFIEKVDVIYPFSVVQSIHFQ